MSDRIIVPPTDKEQAVTGWKMQRRRAMFERAEAAQRAEAVATGRVVRGGTYRVILPPEYSTNPESEAAEDCEYVTLPHSGALAEVAHVELSRQTVTDPRNVWNAARLVTVANGAARNIARRTRGASEADAQDAASLVIADILTRTHGGMPLREDVTAETLHGATRNKLADLIAAREAETPDGGLHTDADAGDAGDAETHRAQRDADPMLAGITDAYDRHIAGTGPDASPWAPETARAIAAADLSLAETDALLVDGAGIRPADIARDTGRKSATVRVSVHRGRATLETRDDLADALRAAARPDAIDRALHGGGTARVMADENGPARAVAPYPDRYPARTAEDEGDAFTVAHAPVHVTREANA